jgi:hypothetical protein
VAIVERKNPHNAWLISMLVAAGLMLLTLGLLAGSVVNLFSQYGLITENEPISLRNELTAAIISFFLACLASFLLKFILPERCPQCGSRARFRVIEWTSTHFWCARCKRREAVPEQVCRPISSAKPREEPATANAKAPGQSSDFVPFESADS